MCEAIGKRECERTSPANSLPKSLKLQRFLTTNAILSLSAVSFLNPTGSEGYTTFSFIF